MKKILFTTIALCALALTGCDKPEPVSDSGVVKASATVRAQSNGLTYEQNNVKRRLEDENKPGVIKHMYLISPYTGDVVFYSTVKGKVTSSGKRLTPTSVVGGKSGDSWTGIPVAIGTDTYRTSEVLQDDGTYGSSDPYLYWWDVNDVYHQQYLGALSVHISSQPIKLRKAVLCLDEVDKK